ncbi:autotransporter domain-containing protein [Bradyrhizobium sp. CCGUVB1N3]|uniref:autotransporter family protein n=1 Tax=Bradyrhizobium sp. CCGUVB1N3 TaxID=2949629 RepID=UPI0020B2091B|nr:autotransporter outer membrane beta-barrel domain-containing protein [Bradyrhizobium sp. CCGUVB1N3]MCP3469206.1 autotransporter domain-containing protein [Bradyrhizobium sp. CCGUVB1N3]
MQSTNATAGSALIMNVGHSLFEGNSTPGNAQLFNASVGSVFDLSMTSGPNGDNKLTAGSLLGGGTFELGANELTVGSNNLSTNVTGVIADGGSGGGTGASLIKVGTGTLTLAGINTYTGATTVGGGVLRVDGSIASSIGVTVDASAALMGTGTVGGTAINSGGALLGGNGTAGTSLAISGNLAFQSGAYYLVAVNPATASSVNVTGSATLGGATVNAVFAPGSYVAKQYTILTAGSVSGTFGSAVQTNLPSNLQTTLSYDATHAYLNLVLSFVPPSGGSPSGNQQSVGNAIIRSFNANGGISLVYSGLTAAGLTQASGETATGAQQATFQAMGQFMGLLTDPFSAGRDTGGSAPPAYADSAPAGAAREAYAMLTKAPPATTFEQRWSVWASGFAGSQTTDGSTAQGSNSATSRLFGTAAGAEYWFSPQTLAGFALAGGGTSFSVANGGSGRSDLFQAGAYLRHTNGPSYISAALAYGWQDVTTDRTVTLAGVDRLRAEFNANAWSGRLEGGYRFIAPWIGGFGITPYAAGQFTTFNLPGYAESVVSGSNAFALAYAARAMRETG